MIFEKVGTRIFPLTEALSNGSSENHRFRESRDFIAPGEWNGLYRRLSFLHPGKYHDFLVAPNPGLS